MPVPTQLICLLVQRSQDRRSFLLFPPAPPLPPEPPEPAEATDDVDMERWCGWK